MQELMVTVGIVANQRQLVKTAKGEMQFGGVIYNDAAVPRGL